MLHTTEPTSPKPFLRWAGGKTWLIKHLSNIKSSSYKNYHEPFLGGGATFFYLHPQNHSYLSDLNKALVETYNAVKTDAHSIIKILKTFKNTEKQYYDVRDRDYKTKAERAAKFIFLNQTSFNGIYRVNLKGIYNVPYGFRSKDFLDSKNLLLVQKALKSTTIEHKDFYKVIDNVKSKDLVFLDPPYTVSHNNNGFIKYNEKLFSLDDQIRLSNLIDMLKRKGAYYILTNAAHKKIDEIFEKGDMKLTLQRASLIGGINAKDHQRIHFHKCALLMEEELKIKLFGKLLSESDIAKNIKYRKADSYNESHNNNSTILTEKLKEGWQVKAELKTKTRIYFPKPLDIAFEDKVWALFAQLGFKLMNADRHFHIPYDKKNYNLTHQVDVFAKDEETVLIVECRTSEKEKVGDFKKELEAMKSKKQGIINSIAALFPSSKPKFKYILATSNLGISDVDEQRLQNIGGSHFSEEIIDYYYFLHSQIGISARYQLLGSLFEGQDIPDMENKIPAIEGKMGGHTYYSFSIEPEKLLKISFVLHRNKANENMMPTYQRLIKKARLKEIHAFIDEESGYFPNSIIINLVTNKNRSLNFEPSNNQVKNAISRVGVLHLPKKYKSAFIIDGQHRLYGYANSKYKSTNTIPVVALINMERSEQVRLFMQINENQKAVSKDLRNTLDADLLWDSESYIDQMKALKSKIAISLGESRNSPFFGKISIGEDKRIITTEYINLAFNRSDFLGKVKKYEIETLGTFYTGDLEKTYKNITDFLFRCFSYLKESLSEIWEQEGNIIVINKGFYGITLLLNDYVNHLATTGLLSSLKTSKSIYEEVKGYLDTVIHFYKDLSDEKSAELKTSYGTPGDSKYWRTLQLASRKNHPEIEYKGLEEYLKKEDKENNDKAFSLIREIESSFLKKRIKEKLENEFGKHWFKRALPEKVYSDAMAIAAKKNLQIEDDEEEKDPWDQLHLIDYREIISKNWQKLFEKDYAQPGVGGNKDAKTSWLVKLNRIRNENVHTYYVTAEELSFIEEIYDWLSNLNN